MSNGIRSTHLAEGPAIDEVLGNHAGSLVRAGAFALSQAVHRGRRRLTTAEHAAFIGIAGEITIDRDKRVPVIHDGETPGGFPVRRESVLDARSFGVRQGQNNTAALLGWIHAVQDKGLIGYLPDGIYDTSTLTIDGPAHLVSDGKAMLRQTFGDDEDLIAVATDDLILDGLLLDVNRTISPNLVESGRGIDCGGVARNNITLRNMGFTGSGQSAIQWHGGQNFKLLGSLFTNNWRGALSAVIKGADDTAVDAYGFELVGNRFFAAEDAVHGNAQVVVRGNGGNYEATTNPGGLNGSRAIHGVVSRN